MNGLELCEVLSQERPGIKVLLMSGDLQWHDRPSISYARDEYVRTVPLPSLE